MGWSCASTTVRRLVRVSRRGRRVERSRCKDGVLARRLRLLGGWVRVGESMHAQTRTTRRAEGTKRSKPKTAKGPIANLSTHKHDTMYMHMYMYVHVHVHVVRGCMFMFRIAAS